MDQSRRRIWTIGLMAALAVLAVALAGFALHQRAASPAPAARAAIVAAAPAMAIGGSDSHTSDWAHLDAGTYRIVMKSDDGDALSAQTIMRGVADPKPQPDCSRGCSNAQAPIVALVGSDPVMVSLLAGHYVLDVVVVGRSAPWTVTVTKAGQ